MIPFFTYPSHKSAYFRLLEYQKNKNLPSYEPDYPLVLFIFLSRIAAGVSIVSLFFPTSLLWAGVSLGCMLLATLASVAHLSVPSRFVTMLRNNKSPLVWEVRLAGALTASSAVHFLSWLGWLQAFRPYLPWSDFLLAILFLISTSTAYRFETHPAWKTSILTFYYLASAVMAGLVLRMIIEPPFWPLLICPALLAVQAVFLLLYRKHLRATSALSLKKLVSHKERWIFLAFLWTAFLLPAVLLATISLAGNSAALDILLACSTLAGILFERVLFFSVERPIFFLSFMENPEANSKYPYWIRG
jgi:DMSO reductase anchor subunit